MAGSTCTPALTLCASLRDSSRTPRPSNSLRLSPRLALGSVARARRSARNLLRRQRVAAAADEAPASPPAPEAPSAASAVIDVAGTATPSAAQLLLGDISFLSASTGEAVPALSLWESGSPAGVGLLCCFSHWGDLTSAEYAQLLLRKVLPLVQEGELPRVRVAVVGLGSVESARAFAELFSFPVDLLHCDPDGAAYRALGFSPGFAPDTPVSAYLKLLPMLAGIGSPGTIQEVLRGYVGDRQRSAVFEGSTPFDVLGQDYQRPFELATQRLLNMNAVLANWAQLAPKQESLLTQQGGTLIFRGGEEVFSHKDSGILMYANVDDVLEILRKQ